MTTTDWDPPANKPRSAPVKGTIVFLFSDEQVAPGGRGNLQWDTGDRTCDLYGRAADCGVVVYLDCGDCCGWNEVLLVSSSFVSVLYLVCVLFGGKSRTLTKRLSGWGQTLSVISSTHEVFKTNCSTDVTKANKQDPTAWNNNVHRVAIATMSLTYINSVYIVCLYI